MKRRTHSLSHLFGLPFTLLVVLSFVTLLLHSVALAQLDSNWTTTGSLNVARSGHTATLLRNGKVLVAGGWNRSALNSAELYDPAMGTWGMTGSLNTPRFGHTVTPLQNGKVLVAGGQAATDSAELYEPDTGMWAVIRGPQIPRSGHTATLLPSGKVLVVGGHVRGSTTALSFTISAELYDPATGTWRATGSLNEARASHTATLLQNGKVLVAGGTNDPNFSDPSPLYSAELYDPATGTWSITGNLNEARQDHPATALSNGKVLVAGGWFVASADHSSELYDPATGRWNSTGALKTLSLYGHTATLLSNGQVIVAGGTDGFFSFDTTQLYEPATGTWRHTANLNTRRSSHTATLLPNGKILVAGGDNRNARGDNTNDVLSSVELYNPHLFSSISISDVTITEGNAGAVNVSFQVNLSEPSTEPVTVTFSTANRTATAGIDYVGTSGTLTFAPGETIQTITVLVNANTILELDKSFLVKLTSATNAMIADGQAVATIINDDGVLPERLSNISTRGGVLTGDNVMIGGFIIDGFAPKRVLVRSRGPSMAGAPFFVPGTLANPFVQIFSGQTVIAQNDNWQDSPNCSGFVCEGAAEIVNTGFDPCTPNPGQTASPPSCALEAAILITLPPGAYTALVTGADGRTGVALVEVFEADASTVSELGNISTRGFVQSGDDVMIGGLIIEGSAPATVLIRARGPSMSGAPFFVPGTLANPFLQLLSGQTVIAQNDNWQDTPSCGGFQCGGAAQITATALDPCRPNPGQPTSPPGCAQESAIFITLPPGGYTAIVSGVGGGTGVGLVEVFELD